MLPSAFSGLLLEDDLLGTGATDRAPTFLGRQEAAGAACDPAIFLVDDDECMSAQGPAVKPPAVAAAAACAPRAAAAPSSSALEGLPATSADELLRELESSMDLLLPAQAMESLLQEAPAGRDAWPPSPPAAGPSTPPSAAAPTSWQPAAFPSIPEERELPAAQLAPRLPALAPLQPTPIPSALFAHSAPSVFVPVPSSLPQPSAAPIPAPSPMPSIKIVLPASRPAEVASVSGSEAASPTGSSTASLQALVPGGGAGAAAYPRIASMPNLHLGLSEAAGCSSTPASPAASRRRASGRARALPRSRSHSDLKGGKGASSGNDASTPTGDDLERYNVPHLPFLTPPHMRKGKGGRQPAADPRLDPSIDPKRARRIMANRLSAAKSKMKQKNAAQLEAQKAEVERLQRELAEATDAMDATASPAGEAGARS